MSPRAVGVVGLGQMGHALAANLADAGFELVTHDLAGPGGSPDGATFVDDVAILATRAETVVFSLPDGTASEQVARAIAAAPGRTVANVIDTSTVGVAAARTLAALLADAAIGLVDAPVSGGPAGARARTLTVMYAGDEEVCGAVAPVLAGLSDRRYRVGAEPGMGQALKLANNFLSATALVATSEAVAFGTSMGLDMATMLEVLNASSGQSAASRDKFVHHVLPGSYSSGFANTLMAKDVSLYLAAATEAAAPATMATIIAGVWQRFAEAAPDADFTRVYPFVEHDAMKKH